MRFLGRASPKVTPDVLQRVVGRERRPRPHRQKAEKKKPGAISGRADVARRSSTEHLGGGSASGPGRPERTGARRTVREAKWLCEIAALMGRSPTRYVFWITRPRPPGQSVFPGLTRPVVASDLRATTSCDPSISARLARLSPGSTEQLRRFSPARPQPSPRRGPENDVRRAGTGRGGRPEKANDFVDRRALSNNGRGAFRFA